MHGELWPKYLPVVLLEATKNCVHWNKIQTSSNGEKNNFQQQAAIYNQLPGSTMETLRSFTNMVKGYYNKLVLLPGLWPFKILSYYLELLITHLFLFAYFILGRGSVKACNFIKSNTPPWVFFILNCENGKASHITGRLLFRTPERLSISVIFEKKFVPLTEATLQRYS